jgi:hypothetical protein
MNAGAIPIPTLEYHDFPHSERHSAREMKQLRRCDKVGNEKTRGALRRGFLGSTANCSHTAEDAMQAPSEALFLAQIVLLLMVGRLMGEAMQRIATHLSSATTTCSTSVSGRLGIASKTGNIRQKRLDLPRLEGEMRHGWMARHDPLSEGLGQIFDRVSL